jgi:ABC-type multidrug transport system ATPase subunit
MDREKKMTVGFISNDEDLMQACDLVFVLDKGRLLASGDFNSIRKYLPEN